MNSPLRLMVAYSLMLAVFVTLLINTMESANAASGNQQKTFRFCIWRKKELPLLPQPAGETALSAAGRLCAVGNSFDGRS